MSKHAWQFIRGIRDSLLPSRAARLLQRVPPPVFIGGTGGSGTRVVARIALHGGIYMGANLDYKSEARETRRFVRRWIPVWLQADGLGLDQSQQARMDRDFRRAVIWHRSRLPHQTTLWGAKHPRLMFLLPYLYRQCPGMKFIHVIRDGRDMAFSNNQGQLEAYGDLYLQGALASAPSPIRSIALWSKANVAASRFGEQALRERYLRIRFEDLCASPREVIDRVFRFLECAAQDAEAAVAEIRPPETIGRWRQQPPDLIAQLLDEGRYALAYFGYLEDPAQPVSR